MPVQDSNPERRNLTVLSLAFVAYYYCGGSAVSDHVSFQLVSMKFSRPELLAVLVWMSLLWFLLRYWQANRGKFEGKFITELQQYKERPYLLRFIAERTGLRPREVDGFTINSVFRRDGRFLVQYVKLRKVTLNADGSIQSFQPGDADITSFRGVRGKWVLLRLLATSALEHPSFAEYIAPYIFFFVAICGPLWRGGV